MIRFIHCADLHLDSPFKGIGATVPALAEALYHAPFKAFAAAVELAILERVDAVIIAGDAFDAAEQSLYARLRFEEQLKRLDAAGINSFYVCGNHDPLPAVRQLRLPESCHVFGREVEKVALKRNGLTIANIYGVSYPSADVRENLALSFPVRESGLPAIAVLHCNAGNITDYQPYAPASIDDLVRTGMDYWALGHVHRRMVLREAAPAIVYPGCLQGTDIRETGAHGCALVTLDDDGTCRLDWHELDQVRYRQADTDITPCRVIADVADAVTETARNLASEMDGRHMVLRLTLTGRPPCGAELRDAVRLEEVIREARSSLSTATPTIWLESLVIKVVPTYDLERLRNGNDFCAELVRQVDKMIADPAAIPEALRRDWAQIFQTGRAAAVLASPNAEQTSAILRDALYLLIDQLKPGEDR